MTGWLAPLTLVLTSTGGADITTSMIRPPPLSDIIGRAASSDPVPVLKLGGGTPLTLVRVASAVEEHHPMLSAAEQRRRQAEGEAMSARGGFDPVLKVQGDLWAEGFYGQRFLEAKLEQPTPLWGISVFGSYRIGVGLGDGDLPVYQEQNRTLDAGELKAGLQVPVWRNGPIDERRAGIRRTEQGAFSARFDRDTVRLGLLLEGAAAYWKWVAAGQTYGVALELVQLAELRDSQLAEKVRRGAVAEVDRAENLRAVLDRRQDLVAAQRALEQAAIKLSLFLRGPDGQPIVAAVPQLPRLPDAEAPQPQELDAGRSDAMQNRPELEFYRAEVAAAKVDVALTENQVSPELDFSLSIGRDYGGEDGAGKIESLEPTEFKVGLDFKLPFFLRKARGKRAKAAAKLFEVREKARFQQDKIEAEILNLWSALLAQAEQVRLADETFGIAVAVAAAERRRFDLGATSLFIVNLREQKAAEAARKRVKARADFALTRSAWALATKTRL